MRVSKWVDFGQEIEIEFGMEDVKIALGEAFGKVGEDRTFRDLGEGEPHSPHHILDALNSVGRFLNSFKDEEIAILNDAQRETISKFLAKASEHFAAKQAQTSRAGTP